MQVYDSTTPFTAIPKSATRICTYVTGHIGLVDLGELQQAFPRARIYCIDVSATAPDRASILDIETGDAKPGDLPEWSAERERAMTAKGQDDFLIRPYCNLSTWPAVREAAAGMPSSLRARVRYWVANPTFPPFWHVVPGSAATQYEWAGDEGKGNYDRSAVSAAWDH